MTLTPRAALWIKAVLIALLDSALVAILETLILHRLGFYRSSRGTSTDYEQLASIGSLVFMGIFIQYFMFCLLPIKLDFAKRFVYGIAISLFSGFWASIFLSFQASLSSFEAILNLPFMIMGSMLFSLSYCLISLTFSPLGYLLINSREYISKLTSQGKTDTQTAAAI